MTPIQLLSNAIDSAKDAHPMDKDDKLWIRLQIRETIQEAVQPVNQALGNIDVRLAKIEKDIHWIKTVGWGIAGVYATVFTLFLTWYLPSQLKPFSERLDQLNQRTANQALKEVAAQDVQEFTKALPELRLLSKQAAGLRLNRDFVLQAKEKLTKTDQSSVEYWPTVLQFIKIASAAVSDVLPSNMQILSINKTTEFEDSTFKNLEVILDGGELENVKFENCRAKFTETPVKMHNVTFINCVFEFPITDQPSPYLKKAGQTILASDLRTVNITLTVEQVHAILGPVIDPLRRTPPEFTCLTATR